jgi:hypothetical protein
MTAGDLDYFSTRPLTERQAFIAMRLFVNRFLASAGDDLVTLCGDLTPMKDGGPRDAAAWVEWTECVDAVLGGDDSTQADA